MFNKLNGWQRLWVAFSAFLFLLFVLYAFLNFPHGVIFSSEEEWTNPSECRSVMLHLRDEWRKSHKDEIFGSHMFPEYKACIDKVELKLKRRQQTTFVIKVFMVWLASVSFVYGAGFSVVWVKNGFLHKKK